MKGHKLMKKIYMADDEKSIRDIVSGFLKNANYSVDTFETGDELLEKFREEPADMVLLDVMMPGTDGITICTTIRETSNVPIVILSAKDTEIDRITGITMGADDYMVKPFSPMELVVRVGSIFRRLDALQNTAQNEILSYGDITLDTMLKIAKYGETTLSLTPTEFALMTYMFSHCTQAVSREELLKNVWKFEHESDTKVTDDVLKRLRKKLVNTKVRIVSVWGFGFKLEQEG